MAVCPGHVVATSMLSVYGFRLTNVTKGFSVCGAFQLLYSLGWPRCLFADASQAWQLALSAWLSATAPNGPRAMSNFGR